MTFGHDARGGTLMEMCVGMFLALLVVLAAGNIILTNARAWEWGRDKMVLQQNATEALEWMARAVRAADSLAVISASEVRTYDAGGALLHTYAQVIEGSEGRLHQDGSDLVDRVCSQFVVTPGADTTSVTLLVELADNAGDHVAAQTRAALRGRSFVF